MLLPTCSAFLSSREMRNESSKYIIKVVLSLDCSRAEQAITAQATMPDFKPTLSITKVSEPCHDQ